MQNVTERQLYSKLLSHNAWSNFPLDIDSLGAGGPGFNKALVQLGTQNQITQLCNKSELWNHLDAIGNLEYRRGLQLKDPNKDFLDEWKRLENPKEKINFSFCKDAAKKRGIQN